MIASIKEGTFLTFDYECLEQVKTTYIILVDDVEVTLDRLGGLSINVKEKVSYVLESEDEELNDTIEYLSSNYIDDINISNLHISTIEEKNKLKEALQKEGTYEAFNIYL